MESGEERAFECVVLVDRFGDAVVVIISMGSRQGGGDIGASREGGPKWPNGVSHLLVCFSLAVMLGGLLAILVEVLMPRSTAELVRDLRTGIDDAEGEEKGSLQKSAVLLTSPVDVPNKDADESVKFGKSGGERRLFERALVRNL